MKLKAKYSLVGDDGYEYTDPVAAAKSDTIRAFIPAIREMVPEGVSDRSLIIMMGSVIENKTLFNSLRNAVNHFDRISIELKKILDDANGESAD